MIDAYRPALAAHGLAVVQTFEPSAPDALVLTTSLLHKLRPVARRHLHLPVERPGPQGTPTSTYARRYCSMALPGPRPDEDDDGNAASQPRQELRQQLRPPESPGDRQAAAVETSNREALIGEIHSRFKALHVGEKFYPWASKIVGRPVSQIGDLDYDDLATVNAAPRHRAGGARGPRRAGRPGAARDGAGGGMMDGEPSEMAKIRQWNAARGPPSTSIVLHSPVRPVRRKRNATYRKGCGRSRRSTLPRPRSRRRW